MNAFSHKILNSARLPALGENVSVIKVKLKEMLLISTGTSNMKIMFDCIWMEVINNLISLAKILTQ